MQGIVIIRDDLTVYAGDKEGTAPCWEATIGRSHATVFHSLNDAWKTATKLHDSVQVVCFDGTAAEKEAEMKTAGFFLRDDTEMRKEWNDANDEAYSFCREGDTTYPFQRIRVFAGAKAWAINATRNVLPTLVVSHGNARVPKMQQRHRDLQ